MFPDASERHWVRFVTQVPDAEMDQNLPVENMTHEPLAFLSGTFKGSQMRWATNDKEGFAIVSTFRRQELFCGMESTFSLITATLLTFLTLKRT